MTTEQVKIAFLGNCTTDYIIKAITQVCADNHIAADIYNCPYIQYNQDVFDKESQLYRSKPELVILFLEAEVLLPQWFSVEIQMENHDKKLQAIEDAADVITALAEEIHKNSETKIVINNLKIPYFSPLGILDGKFYPGLRDMIALLNCRLTQWASQREYAYIFDYNAFSAYHGGAHLVDNKMYYLTKTTVSLRYAGALAREYMKYILPLKYRTKKCLVLDLDNTLWGGTAGEDGLSGIKLDIANGGRSFYDFQKEVLNLYQKGVILAVCSKNNAEDALEIIENHPHMVLKKEHFSVLKINWQNKAQNIKEIAKELNIGTDSIVFFDDSIYERELVKAVLPEVTVIDVPADTSKYPDTIRNLVEFERLRLTAEDIGRNTMYAGNKKRGEAQQKFSSVNEFLKSLCTRVTLAFSNDFTIPRIAQLTQKTNQFNMTTKRYSQQDILTFHRSDDYMVVSIQVTDIYGDNGITGVCIVHIRGDVALIDTFLLSCRVMGRQVEYAFLDKVVELLRARGIKQISALYIKTEKNKATADFYKNAGFTVVSENENGTDYVLNESKQPLKIGLIETVVKGDAAAWTINS